jgi:hypothetical protein
VTPVLRHRFGWKKASMAAALGYHPAGTRRGCAFTCKRTATTPSASSKVLEQLGRFYAGQRVVLLWDGLSAHWSMGMRAWLDSQRDWLQAERLPAYAPDLNPVEYLWANLKDVELANLPGASLVEVADAPSAVSSGSAPATTWSPDSSLTPA